MKALILALCLFCVACSGAEYTLDETIGPAHVVCTINGNVVYEGIVNGLLDELNDSVLVDDADGKEVGKATANCVVTLNVD